MTHSARKIPESVTGEDLKAAMQPLFDLLGVDLMEVFLHGLHFDFASGVMIVSSVSPEAGLTASNPDVVPGNRDSEYAVVTHVRIS